MNELELKQKYWAAMKFFWETEKLSNPKIWLKNALKLSFFAAFSFYRSDCDNDLLTLVENLKSN